MSGFLNLTNTATSLANWHIGENLATLGSVAVGLIIALSLTRTSHVGHCLCLDQSKENGASW